MSAPEGQPPPRPKFPVPRSAFGNARWLLRRLKRANPVEARNVLIMLAGVMMVILLNTFGQLQLNAWQGSFYNALEARETAAVVNQFALFVAIAGMLLVLVVAQAWLTEAMKVRARMWLTRHTLEIWLAPRRAYLLGFAGDIAQNPDQRIGQDANLLADSSIGFAIGLGQSSLLLVSFIGVLWTLSNQVVFTWHGSSFTIPGYMVWCALAFTAAGSSLTYLVGRPLIAFNAQRYSREGEFRSGLARVNDNAGVIALERGEADEFSGAAESLNALTLTMQALVNARARLTWVTSGYGWLGLVVPIIVAAPGYLAGNLNWGGLFMVIGGFNQVQNALRWFIDHYASITEWQANLQRVAALLESLDQVDEAASDISRIARRDGAPGEITLDNLAVCLPGDLSTCILLGDRHLVIKSGERLRFLGARGTGKTTLFMALAGLWPWGRGTIVAPSPFNALFLPERPYIPKGTLHEAVAYPLQPQAFGGGAMAAAMLKAGLGHLIPQIELITGWVKDLPLGDQQRLSIARLLLHRPEWAILDDCLSSLEESDAKVLFAMLLEQLPGTAFIATSHASGIDGFYQRTIELGGVASLPPFTLVAGKATRNE